MSRFLPRDLLRPALLFAGTIAAAPAGAQYYGGYPPPPFGYNAPPPIEPYGRSYGEVRRVSPGAIVDRLEDQGYEDIDRPRYTGTLYLVDATAPGGMRVRLAVDAVRGVVLNRTAIGGPRGYARDDDDDDRMPRRGYAGRPDPYPPEMPLPGLGRPDAAPRGEPDRREAARVPDLPGSGESDLRAPADPRLAPSREGAGRAFEGQTDRRPDARAQPQPRPSLGTAKQGAGAAAVDGLNPDAAPAKRKPAPQQQARRPAGPPSDEAKPQAPRDATGQKPAAAPPAATAEARPSRPVRVIPGVTPLNGGGSGAVNQLDNLPPPPAVGTPKVAD